MTDKFNIICVVPQGHSRDLPYLQDSAYQYHVVAGDESAAHLATGAVDLVLFVTDGLADQAGAQVQTWRDQDQSFPPVLAIGPAADLAVLSACLEAGAADFALSDGGVQHLDQRIRSLLGQEASVLSGGDGGDDESLARDLLNIVLPLGTALSAEKDFDRLIERILLEARKLCHADGGTLYLRRNDHLDFVMLHTQSLGIAMGGTTGVEIPVEPLALYNPETGDPNYHNVATMVALKGESVNVPDIYSEGHSFDFSGTRAFDKQNNYRTVSTLSVPLKDYDDNVIGVLQLINAQDPTTGKVKAFDAYLQQVVESLASLAAVALNNQILMEAEKRLLKIEQDMAIATQLQHDFLPAKVPDVKRWEIVPFFQAARGVAGDFYDVFRMSSGHICIVLADVCDKGVGAALFMVLFRSLIRSFSAETQITGLSDFLSAQGAKSNTTKSQFSQLLATLSGLNTVVRTNDYVYYNHMQANMFATMFFGVLDSESGLMKYVNGGHNPPIVIRTNGEQEFLQPTGPAVGMFPGTNFKVEEVRFAPGDALFVFTDGVTEARAADGEFFGEDRLEACLDVAGLPASELVERVKTQLFAHTGDADQFDDITMMAVSRSTKAVSDSGD